MTQDQETVICLACSLSACVGTESTTCPLFQARAAEAQERLPYFRLRYEQRQADRAALRGYWPEIHGRV